MRELLAATSSSSIVVIAVIFGMMILMMVLSIVPQKKKQKKAQEMLSKLSKGDKIKTIGGFVGTIMAIDDATNTMNINLGDENNQIIATIDKGAVFTVINANPTVVETAQGKVEVDEASVKSLDDAEDDAKNAAKAKARANKKAKAKDVKSEDIFQESSDNAVADMMKNNEEKK